MKNSNYSRQNADYSIRFTFVLSGAGGVKEFAYISLENDSEVSIWMSSLYMTKILQVYGQVYMSDKDRFKDSLLGAQSLQRRAVPYGPNKALESTSSKLNKSFSVYGLFVVIPKKKHKCIRQIFQRNYDIQTNEENN